MLHSPKAEQGAEASEPSYESIVFVPAGEGKKIVPGNRVEVVPATVKREEHGFIRGRVVSISELPATKLAMEAALEHPELVEVFLKRYAPGVLLQVHVHLDEDARVSPGQAPAVRPSQSLLLVVIVRIDPIPQDGHALPGRDRGREAKADQADPPLDQEARQRRLVSKSPSKRGDGAGPSRPFPVSGRRKESPDDSPRISNAMIPRGRRTHG